MIKGNLGLEIYFYYMFFFLLFKFEFCLFLTQILIINPILNPGIHNTPFRQQPQDGGWAPDWGQM